MNCLLLRSFRLLAFILLALASGEVVQAADYALPQSLGDQNTTVSFEVDSTWHLVKGSTKQITGEIKRSADGKIQGEILVPVSTFFTDNSSRDSRLQEVMAAERFPTVRVVLEDAAHDCPAQVVEQQGGCSGKAQASMQIRDVTKVIVLDYRIERDAAGYVVNGTYAFKWADFNVEDPSIFIAKLDPVVTVKYSLKLSRI